MNIHEYGQYFFTLIQRAPGQPADDYEAVLGASGIPKGLDPYVVPDASMPHHALTQQVGSDPDGGGPAEGRIAGRMFLPTATPDDKGYYSHPISPLKDGPTPGSLLWEWRDLGGPAVVTPGGDSTAPPATGSGLTEADVQRMIDEAIAPLTARLSTLEDLVSQPLHAHGPVNLPIVVESLTSMRAKGDIDVDVMYGAATPPPVTGGDDLTGGKLLLWLRRRIDEGTEP